MKPPDSSAAPHATPEEWDELRLAFHRSILMDTPLASLAQNIDGCVWPIRTPDETPCAYMDLSHVEVFAALRARSLPLSRFDDLVEIMRGTLSFDNSFGAMLPVTAVGPSDTLGEGLKKSLARLDIPEEFPLELCAFTPGTKTFCRAEGMATLKDFLLFAGRASRKAVVGGEFRELLNAVAHVDEATLARYLPFRPKSTGLHLIEALALLVRPMDIEQRVLVARNSEEIPDVLKRGVDAYTTYFPSQLKDLRAQVSKGTPVSRMVVSLDDLSLESAVCSLLNSLLDPDANRSASTQPKSTAILSVSTVTPLAKNWINSLWPWAKR